jgi:hypothetical protein
VRARKLAKVGTRSPKVMYRALNPLRNTQPAAEVCAERQTHSKNMLCYQMRGQYIGPLLLNREFALFGGL